MIEAIVAAVIAVSVGGALVQTGPNITPDPHANEFPVLSDRTGEVLYWNKTY